MERLKEIMYPLFDEYEDCDEITEALRSLLSEGEITEEEYDQCQAHWDAILNEWERR